jgi:hypothetical protein
VPPPARRALDEIRQQGRSCPTRSAYLAPPLEPEVAADSRGNHEQQKEK